jgi:hypothetical protein
VELIQIKWSKKTCFENIWQTNKEEERSLQTKYQKLLIVVYNLI